MCNFLCHCLSLRIIKKESEWVRNSSNKCFGFVFGCCLMLGVFITSQKVTVQEADRSCIGFSYFKVTSEVSYSLSGDTCVQVCACLEAHFHSIF